MNINHDVFENIKRAKAQVLVVTKYHDKAKTETLIDFVEQNYSSILFGVGENRVESLIAKDLPRDKVHFIGALQTKKLRKITEYCSVIHSLDSLKHAERLDNILGEREKGEGESTLGVFLQVKLDLGKLTGIAPEALGDFIEAMKAFKNLEVVGISGMGKRMSIETQEKIKQEEFQLLLDLRDQYLPGKLVSAGTTQDYQMALDMGIDIVRVGKGIVL